MRSMPTDLLNYFLARKMVIEEKFLWVYGRNPTTNAIEEFGFWTGDQTITITVTNRLGANVTRNYVGSGTIITAPVIVGTPSLGTQNAITFELSGIIDYVKDSLRGKNIRNASCEVHILYRHEDTDLAIAPPELVYIGQGDGATEHTNALSYDGNEAAAIPTFTFTIIPHIRGFRKNFKTRSYQHGLERAGDTFFKFCGTSWMWRIWWGAGRKSHKDKPKKNRRTDGYTPDSWGRD